MKIRKMICAMLAITLFAMLLTGCGNQKGANQAYLNSAAQTIRSELERIVYDWNTGFNSHLKEGTVQEFNITISNGECTVSAGDQKNFIWSSYYLEGGWGQVGKGMKIQSSSEATTPEEYIAIRLASLFNKESYFQIYVAMGDEGNKIFVACTSDKSINLNPGVNCPKPDISDGEMSFPKSFKYSGSTPIGTSPVVEAE